MTKSEQTAEDIANAIRVEAESRAERQGIHENHRAAYATGYLMNRLETALGIIKQIEGAPTLDAARYVASEGMRILTP